jgi:signal transduction histidine kinase
MRIIGFFGVLLALLAGAAVAYLYLESDPSQAPGQQQNVEKILTDIRRLQDLDSERSIAVLRTLNSHQSDFDTLTAFQPRIRAQIDGLRTSEAADPAPSPDLDELLARYLGLLDAKEQAIEAFKSDYAIIRNSEKYLPEAAAALDQSAREADEEALALQIEELSSGIGRFLESPNEQQQMAMFGDVDQLKLQLAELPMEIIGPMNDFLSHAQELLQRKVPLDQHLEQITAPTARQAATDLIDATLGYQRQQRQGLDENQQRIFLVAAVATVSLFIVSLLLSLSRTRRSEHDEYDNIMSGDHGHQDEDPSSGNRSSPIDELAAMITDEIEAPMDDIENNVEALQSSTHKLLNIKGMFETLDGELEAAKEPDALRHLITAFSDDAKQTWRRAMLDDMPDMLDEIHEGVAQIQHTVASLNDFTGHDRPDEDWFQLNDCIDDAIAAISEQLPENIEVDTHLGKLPPIYGSATEMEQVFVHLIINAADAIEAAGRSKGIIRITTGKERKGVSIQVLDNGSGMNRSTEKKIFEPFFTTKEVGEGAGLGLAIVKRVIDDHQGTILLKSVADKGSNFKITLPRKREGGTKPSLAGLMPGLAADEKP